MSDAEVVAAIRHNHLKANISEFEDHPEMGTLHWDKAWLDPGGTVFGLGPYVKLPITMNPEWYGCKDEIVIRVYAPERLRKRLARDWEPEGAAA